MLYVKSSTPLGCAFLGKGIVGHPEMGAVTEARLVVFDKWNSTLGCWTEEDEMTLDLYRTDTGFTVTGDQLKDGTYRIEEYAPNWRVQKKDAWS